jgi:DNA repair photolyase
MTEYIEHRALTPVLPSKRDEIDEHLLVTRHLRIYDGCEFGCPYCDGWSYTDHPINTRIRIPVDLPERLAEDLSNVQPGDVIGMVFGEPYQPAEQQYRVTRKTLETLASLRQPCVILTKSPKVMEDLPLLQEMNRESFAIVVTTVVTVDGSLAQLLEPDAPPVAQRIEAITRLKHAGVPSGFALLPIFPFLTDRKDHIARTLDAMAIADPDFLIWGPLWLPNDRHRERIQSLLRLSMPNITSTYPELYRTNPAPRESYQRMLDRQLFMECLQRNLNPRIPPQIYVNHLPEATVSALLQKNQQFIDQVSSFNG